MMRFLLIFSMATLLPCLTSAKRIAPTKVDPVIHAGIRYIAPNDVGRRAYIEAWDVRSNKKLWDLTVFTNPIDPKLEEDVQWVFINKLSIEGDVLLVTSDDDRKYQVDLKTKVTKEVKSDPSRPSDSVTQHDDIPEAIRRAVNGSLAKGYDLSFQINPFYLQGDFNGDGKADIAVLVKQRSTGKFGIAIVHGSTKKVTMLGAGTAIGNGGDDFDWMDSWEIYSKDSVAGGTSVPKLRGDALLVSKSEAASALIYWNGDRYVWLQRGD